MPPLWNAEIAGCRLDAGNADIVICLRSRDFPEIARGAPIPEAVPYSRGVVGQLLFRD
jgi:hypothetical protein